MQRLVGHAAVVACAPLAATAPHFVEPDLVWPGLRHAGAALRRDVDWLGAEHRTAGVEGHGMTLCPMKNCPRGEDCACWKDFVFAKAIREVLKMPDADDFARAMRVRELVDAELLKPNAQANRRFCRQ